MTTTPAFDAWVARARSVPIENEIARRGIKLNGKIEQCGPCPVCGGEDRFAINTAKQVWNCRGCGCGGDTIGLVEHLDKVDFVTACTTLTGEAPPSKQNGKGAGFAATYNYKNETGLLVFQKVKNPPGHAARFWCRRPDRNGGWINDTKGIAQKPLYRTPELIEAIKTGHEIAIAEGEKDVDNLYAISIPATCNFDGAADTTKNPKVKPKWKPHYSERLRGASVVVFSDNDPQGVAHAEAVCEMCHGVAARVRRLDLALHWPGMPKGADISDWLALGHTREELDNLIAQAPEWQPPKPQPQHAPMPASVRPEDFYAYMPEHKYIFIPTGQIWPASSIDERLQRFGNLTASQWLDQNRPVEQMTWSPGEPRLIKDKLIVEGGWFPRLGSSVFNLYKPAIIRPMPGNPDRWLAHIENLYGADAPHAVKWWAHRVQKPQENINHALVLGGKQGIGKDTIFEPVKRAVGPWNCIEVSPKQVLGRFNGFLKSVILRISEASDLGEFDRYAFYDHMKSIIVAPPDVLRIDEKNRQEYAIPNVCGVTITTNYKSNGIYLPADDRRHFVMWSDCDKREFSDSFWKEFWTWYETGGCEVVAHYLQSLDLSSFNPKAPPPQTNAFFEIVNSSRPVEDAEMQDALDLLDRPPVVTIASVIAVTPMEEFKDYLKDRRKSRSIPHRFEDCGYTSVHNPDAEDGQWRVSGRRQTVYARKTLSFQDRLTAAGDLSAGRETKVK